MTQIDLLEPENRLNGLYEKYTGKDLSFWTSERREIAKAYWDMMDEYEKNSGE